MKLQQQWINLQVCPGVFGLVWIFCADVALSARALQAQVEAAVIIYARTNYNTANFDYPERRSGK